MVKLSLLSFCGALLVGVAVYILLTFADDDDDDE